MDNAKPEERPQTAFEVPQDPTGEALVPTDEADEDRQFLLPGALPSPGGIEMADRLHLYWNQGPHLDGRHFQIMFGGRIQFDLGVLNPSKQISDEFGPDGTDFETAVRRARLRFVGVVRKRYYLRFEYDFARENFADVLIDIKDLRYIERLQFGNLREPFSLEQMASSNDITFMEFGLPNAIVPGRNSGVRIDGVYLDQRLAARPETPA